MSFTCPNCKIITPSVINRSTKPRIKFCEACTQSHQIKQERDALRVALEKIADTHKSTIEIAAKGWLEQCVAIAQNALAKKRS